ncbi:MAG: arginine--tRNA ligase [candidate division WOR-3 bacterium]
MISQKIKNLIQNCWPEPLPPKHEVTFILDSKFGDYASNVAFLLAQKHQRSAIEIANELAAKLKEFDFFSAVSVAGKGFINFTISEKVLIEELKQAALVNYGRLDIGKGKKILVEYISANPTGPLNVVQARAGAFGNALVNLLKFVNYHANSEYYVNNTGTQIELLYQSLCARINQLKGIDTPVPENGYPGEYLIEIGQEILHNDIEEDHWREYVLQKIISLQKKSLEDFGIKFDNFAFENSFSSKINLVLNKLQNFTYVQDNALWFKSSAFEDNEDRVLITADKRPTYFLSDLAYHWDKFERGYDILINIWGPDHHGYIPRMKSGLTALGLDAKKLIIIIAQQVNLLRNGKKVVMSKRAGEYITLDDVLSEIGADALKFFLLMRKASQHLEFDLALAKKTSQENPVYYVQYAYARIKSIFRHAQEKNIFIKDTIEPDDINNIDLSVLHNSYERALIKIIVRFPDVISVAADNFEPHHLIYYLLDLANAFHKFYENVRVVSDDVKTTIARIFLCQIVIQILKNIFEIIGISAPERM